MVVGTHDRIFLQKALSPGTVSAIHVTLALLTISVIFHNYCKFTGSVKNNRSCEFIDFFFSTLQQK